MVLHFTGDIKELMPGIRALAPDMHVTLGEEDGGGTEVCVRFREGAPLRAALGADGQAVIEYGRKCCFFRACSLLVQHMNAGETEFDIRETPQFDTCGPMFDVSQGNAVIRVEKVKALLRQMAQMGLTMLMLYCEDSFDVRPQPYFGYMRARYTEEDIRECDDYADMFGIEMIPCIQTLAHLVDVLKWNVYDDIRENDVCLLVGEEKTYRFIRDLLTEATRPFRSRRVHIGMDEAYHLGRGAYQDRNGVKPVQEIMREHLGRVLEIVRELGLEPMMWSDMFFHGYGYYGDTPIPQEVVDCCPKDVRLVYWDYYHNDEASYETCIARHRRFGEPIFAGGIWTWIGFAPHWKRTFLSTEAALSTCRRLGVREVFVTIWGDNGTECLCTANTLGLALYAEHAYSEKIDYEKLRARFEFITGARYDDFLELGALDETPGVDSAELTSCNPSKFLMWQDILTGLCDKNIEGLPLDAHYAALAEKLAPMRERNGAYNGLFDFSWHVAHTLALKAEMGLRVTKAYREGNREELGRIAAEDLPELRRRMEAQRECHMENWFALYKALGWDIMDMRYGSLLARIDSAEREIGLYLAGKLARLEELEEERLDYNGRPGMISYANWFGRIVSASRIAPYC